MINMQKLFMKLDAVFSGTWKTLDTNLDILSGDVGGDDSLTRGTTTLKLLLR